MAVTDSAVAEPIAASRLQEHTGESDCWLAIHGKVYDVSKYLLEHPGGMDVMMEHAGAPRRLSRGCLARQNFTLGLGAPDECSRDSIAYTSKCCTQPLVSAPISPSLARSPRVPPSATSSS
jgi:Cytochrome b5-like Heme/Steroid binding domain